MEDNFETGTNPKQIEQVPKVALHFFRHAEAERDPNIPNERFELSAKGRKQALDKSELIEGKRNLRQTMPVGSSRDRSRQTAMIMSTGKSFGVSGEKSFEELERKLNKPFQIAGIGRKIGTDPKLDFHLDKKTPFGKEAYKAVFENQNYLRFLINRSDSLAIETDDENASTYSRQASNVAKIIQRYAKIGDQWSKYVATGEYDDPKLERFLGTHGGVAESFLLKVIERVKGKGERDRLLDLMPHQFDYTEGFDVELVNSGSDQKVHISFKKEDAKDPTGNFVFDEDVSLEVIDEIAAETGVMSEKFKEWTEGKEAAEARISIFNGIRDIPYSVVPGRDPKNAQEKLLLENKGSCTAKHVLMKSMLDKLQIPTRYVSHRFRWSDLPVDYPEDVRKLSEQMPVCDHLFCQAFIDGNWVSVDTTWDLPLEKGGFPVNKNWDGFSGTTVADRSPEEIYYYNLIERTESKRKLVAGYTDAEQKVQPEFYKKFNAWLDRIRSEK